ncbi:hypothetical protein [Nannocystis bainbridge]|uniref:Uncharacterized protein n=1 Tax=Nannocystis bainbridge TaxID=2995303 RepID=A0ABT5E4L6_9BACT|nr:hypothetical protein [Nannocystis bainbridge]MDC0720675.1 hypothetical protein [Nannocystis bainbridge]
MPEVAVAVALLVALVFFLGGVAALVAVLRVLPRRVVAPLCAAIDRAGERLDSLERRHGERLDALERDARACAGRTPP